MADGLPPFSAQLVSDGTLRMLAFVTLLNDPDSAGLLCMEELENGVHPVRLRTLIEEARQSVPDPQGQTFDDDLPLRQVITNSHSPVVLDTVRERGGEAFLADMIVRTTARGPVRRTRVRPVAPSGQGALFEDAEVAGKCEVERLLI